MRRQSDLEKMRDVADDHENDVLDGLAVKAGILWKCRAPRPGDPEMECFYYNEARDKKCGGCGTRRPQAAR